VRVELPVENLMQSEKLNEEDLLSEVLTSASCTRKIIEVSMRRMIYKRSDLSL